MIESMSELESTVKAHLQTAPLNAIESATGIPFATLDRYRHKADINMEKYNLLKIADYFAIQYAIKGE